MLWEKEKMPVTSIFSSGKESFWKHCGRRRKCWLLAFSPFPTMFCTLSNTNFNFWVTIVWSSTTSLYFYQSKILLFGKELRTLRKMNLKTWLVKEEMLVSSIYSFSHNDFYRCNICNLQLLLIDSVKNIVISQSVISSLQHKIFKFVYLTLSQTTNFRLFQTERVCRRQFQISWKWKKVIQTGYKQFLLFPQCFQKACFPGASKGVIVWEWVKESVAKELTLYHTIPTFNDFEKEACWQHWRKRRKCW